MRKFISLVVILSALSVLGACDRNEETAKANLVEANTAQEKQVVKIAYLPITHATPLFEEQELISSSADSGIKIELVRFGSWTELMDALNSGRVDGASVLIELAMKAKEQGIPLKAVALGHHDGNVLIADNEIKNAQDLKGKTIAVPHRQSSHYLLVIEALAKVGLTINDVKITELSPAEMPAALASGQIDAYCVAEPFGAKAIVHKLGHVLFTSSELWPHSLCCVLVFTERFIKEHNLLAKKTLNFYRTAAEKLDSDKTLALFLVNKYLKLPANEAKLSFEWISFNNMLITVDDYKQLSIKIENAGLSKKVPDYKDFVANEI